MRYRALDENFDYTFGQGAANFLINSPAMVAQSVRTRLLLMRGEWFLDKTEGTPYSTAILGAHTKPFYDLAIQERVLRTPGVIAIEDYNSNLNGISRKLSVSMRVMTAFGPVPVEGAF